MDINERSVEYRYVFKQVTEFAPQTVMDMGTGKTALPALIKACGEYPARTQQKCSSGIWH